jgi:cytochrome c oxidase subunit 3
MSHGGESAVGPAAGQIQRAAGGAVELGNLDTRKVGMIAFLGSEAAFFGTLFVAYGVYLGASTSGPTPKEALRLADGLIGAAFLLPSSVTVALAARAFAKSDVQRFLLWLSVTMALGVLFLLNTAREWYDLIAHHGLTLGTNLFGTTFYTLVGFHAGHVTIGLLIMAILASLALSKRLLPARTVSTDGRPKHETQTSEISETSEVSSEATSAAPELFSWYWHFVDAVWVGILLMVYVLGR